MIESRFRKTLGSYNDIVYAVEILEITEEEQIGRLKAKLRLFDGTILWVREIIGGELLAAYSYYWLRPDESIIIGWDNAPHHKNISSFPHHKHIDNKAEPSEEKCLRDVLDFIRNFLMYPHRA